MTAIRTRLRRAWAVFLLLAGASSIACSSESGRPAADIGQDVAATVDAVLDVAPDLVPVDVEGADGSPIADSAVDSGDARDSAVDAGPDYPLPPPGPGFHRDGAHIRDDQGRVVFLHGANVSNSAKGAKLPWHGPEDLEALAAEGLNSVRLLIFWAALMPEDGVLDQEYIADVVERIGWARDAGLLVVLDMHQDLYGPGFHGGWDGAPRWTCDEALYESYEPRSPWWMNYTAPEMKECFDRFYADDELFAKFVDAWGAMATAVADDPTVVGFDILNEPAWGSMDPALFVPEVWQARQEQTATTLLGAAPAKLVFFEGVTILGTLGVPDAFVVPADPRIAFGPHYYHPSVHEGADYDDAMAPGILKALDGIGASAERLGGVPVWLGEFGGPTQLESFLAYLDLLMSQMAERGWSWAYWSDDKAAGGFSLRDEAGVPKHGPIVRLGHPYARRIPGDVVTQQMDFAEWKYELRFAWTRDAALEVWTGAPHRYDEAASAVLEHEASGDSLACTAAPDAAEGVMLCGPAGEETIHYGEVYRLTVRGAPAAAPVETDL